MGTEWCRGKLWGRTPYYEMVCDVVGEAWKSKSLCFHPPWLRVGRVTPNRSCTLWDPVPGPEMGIENILTLQRE